VDDVLDLFQGWDLLFPLGSRNPCVLVGEIEIVSIGVLKAGLEARLPRQPLEEAFELGESGIKGRFAQSLSGPLRLLLGKMLLKATARSV